MLRVDRSKIQYCHGHTKQCTHYDVGFSVFFCLTDVKCIAFSYIGRIYAGHILVSSAGRCVVTHLHRNNINTLATQQCNYMMYLPSVVVLSEAWPTQVDVYDT